MTSSFDLDPESVADPVSRIFDDAARYSKLLSNSPSGFSVLVAHDLDPAEKAVAARYAKLNVASQTFLPDANTVDEPDSYDDDDDDTTDEDIEHQHTAEHRKESWTLSPEQAVDVLVRGFGPIAANDEQELLILEADGALFQDVCIVGVIHLTTHRLAFHASLLAVRPDLLPSQQVVKAGPASILHPAQGLLSRTRTRGPAAHTGVPAGTAAAVSRWRKRRVWFELAHDMLSTYASSSDEDRIRPIRSVLLSSIQSVQPLSAKHPRRIVITFGSTPICPKDPAAPPELREGVAEFDTDESAAEWRRELQGALYLFRHRRTATFESAAAAAGTSPDNDDATGIRVNIPLHRIASVAYEPALAHLAGVISLALAPGPGAPACPTAQHDPAAPPPCLRLASIFPDAEWARLAVHVAHAKAVRAARRAPAPAQGDDDDDDDEGDRIVVDFGPLSFFENPAAAPADEDAKARTVRAALGLADDGATWLARARLRGAVASAGFLALTPRFLGFWAKSLTHADTRLRVPLHLVAAAAAPPPAGRRRAARVLALHVAGQADLRFEFRDARARDDAARRVEDAAARARAREADALALEGGAARASPADAAAAPAAPAPPARADSAAVLSPLARTVTRAVARAQRIPAALRASLPKPLNVPAGTLLTPAPLRVACVTIGSRGDVQPYIALGRGLRREGHRVVVVTHAEYKAWVEGFGLEHRTAGGDPGALMKLSVENKMFSPEFFKESLTNFRGWLDELLVDAWAQCRDAQVLLESPSAMAGVHIAEALNIPYFRCFTMPWTKTAQFPHAFLSPPIDSPTFNSASYVLFDNVLWAATSGQINRWRRRTLGLPDTDMGHLAQAQITFIYNFSPAVVPKPVDWADHIVVSGYWFLDAPDPDWTPPAALVAWMAQARADGKPIVYVGFGSITVPRPAQLAERIVQAVRKSGVRAIVSKGWSARMSAAGAAPAAPMPPECYALDDVPHDWLFPQIDAALHHGGAGTTGASLRAGIPTLIKPWFGDQFFWASRVQKLGAGLKVPSTKVNDLADALTKATTSRVMKEKAASVGARIRSEDGVHAAIHAIYTYLARAGQDRTTLA